MKTPREIIAEALFQYLQGADAVRRGHSPWGRESSEWRADAVIDALTKAGISFCEISHPAGQEKASDRQ